MNETIIKVKGKIVGKIIGDKYVTYRNKKKHFMFKFEGYGISQKVLDFLKNNEVETVKIIVNKNEEYEIPLKEYLNSSKTYRNVDDFQRFVSVNEKYKNKKLFDFENNGKI